MFKKISNLITQFNREPKKVEVSVATPTMLLGGMFILGAAGIFALGGGVAATAGVAAIGLKSLFWKL